MFAKKTVTVYTLHFRLEITQILKYMVLRATGLTFSDVAVSPMIVFLIVALSVTNGVQLSLFLAVFLLSMSRFVADNIGYYLIRALTFIFDANASVKRIQVVLSVKFLGIVYGLLCVMRCIVSCFNIPTYIPYLEFSGVGRVGHLFIRQCNI